MNPDDHHRENPDANPYAPPKASIQKSPSAFRHGLTWYIVFGGLAGAFGAVPFFDFRIPEQFGMLLLESIFVGTIAGGLIFRYRSRHWPHDPTVRYRQIVFSLLAITLPPAILFLLATLDGAAPVNLVLATLLGVAISFAIFAGGTRRFRMTQSPMDA